MALKTVPKITKKQITENGVQKLADRPNLSGQYGASGLSAAQLKLWFDKLATLLAERINEIVDTISSEEAANYIRVCLDEYGVESFGDLVTAFTDGNFASKIIHLSPSAGSEQKQALQTIINNIAKTLADIEENKLNKVTDANAYKRAYIIMPDGTQATVLISETALGGAIPLYTSDGRINVAIPIADANAVNKGYSDAQDKLLGATVDLSIDTSTYIMTLQLKNTAGAVLSTAKVDFPIESVVVGGSYSGGVLTLRLKSGEVLNVDISSIVDGLIDTATFNRGVETLNARIDDTHREIQALADSVETREIYAHYAFVAIEADTAKSYTKGGKIDKKFRDIEAKSGYTLSLSMDDAYRLTVGLKNKRGDVVSSGMVDLPIESLITSASYANKILTLKFQSGETIKVDISDIVTGLVSQTRTINSKPLSADITLTASDVGAYSKTETDSKISGAKQELLVKINEIGANAGGGGDDKGGYSIYAEQADTARNYTKGGAIDRAFKKYDERLKALENNT